MPRPGFHPLPPPARGKGWWTGAGVLAFIGAGSALSVLGTIAFLLGVFGLFVAAEGGGEGVEQISDDFFSNTTWLFYLFLVMQVVSIVLGFWGGRNCLRGKPSGAIMASLLGVLGVAEIIWLGLAFGEPGRMIVGLLAALALIVCPVIALRFPQPQRR